MIFISYYTKNTPYEEVMFKHLEPSLKRWNLKYDIRAIEDKGSWNLNTSYKARFILEMLEKHKEDVCFLDADAEIWEYPILLFNIPNSCHIACHRLDWYKFWRKQEGYAQRELLSGTLVFKYNEKALELVKKYLEICEKNIGKWEQKLLQQIIENNPEYNLYDLPISYCAIKKFDGSIPEYIGRPIIVHFQASRQYRNFKRKT